MDKHVQIYVDDSGYADIDDLMDLIRSLPKVQRAIIHTHLTEEMDSVSDEVKSIMRKARAAWMYE